MDNPVPPTNPVQTPESSDTKGNKRERGWIKEGIILALCTFTGYLVAYAYEEGFCHHFSIPSSFIEIDVVTILVSVIYTFVIVSGLAIGMAMYYEGPHDELNAPSVRALKIFEIAQITTTKTLQFRHAVLGPG
jgi:Ni,Fe-hydrogenase I cytochrome b subunit